MNKTLTALATVALLMAPGALAEGKTFDAGSFSNIKVNAVMDVVYTPAPKVKVTVETPSGDFSDARIENDGDTLVVTRNSLKKKNKFLSWGSSIDISKDGETVKINGKHKPRYTVYVSGPDLDGIQVSQSSTFKSSAINSDDLEVNASSSAEIELAGTSGATRLSASSAGEIDAKGLEAKSLRVSASSSGEASGTVTGTGETVVDASSSGEATIFSKAAASFIVEASSGGSAELSGACKSIDIDASSGATVEADELRCQSAKADASSGADVDAFATGLADGHASSGGSVKFAGGPSQQNSQESSGGSVRFSN